MAQLRYTRAIACGTFITVGIVGIYIYKKRGKSKKTLDNPKKQHSNDSSSVDKKISNTTIEKEGSSDFSVHKLIHKSECDHHTVSLPQLSQELNTFDFTEDPQAADDMPCQNTEMEYSQAELVEVEEEIVIGEEQQCVELTLRKELSEVNTEDSSENSINRQENEMPHLDCAKQEENTKSNIVESTSSVNCETCNNEGSHVESDQSSEVNSEGSSNDSGHGSTSILHSSSVPDNVPITYQFEFPTKRVGKMIGKQGKSIKLLKEKTGTKIFLEKIPYNINYQNCIIRGLPGEVDAAIKEIQYRFPDVDVHRVVESPQTPHPETIVPALQLFDEIVNDVLVSNVITACHIFVQQPSHPSFRALPRLQNCMASCYSQLESTPPLPQPIDVGMICAAPINESWCRAQIMDVHTDTDEIDVKLLDYGGYARLDSCCLRQIRSDFMSLPFQAVECYLAHIAPLEGEESFSEPACAFVEELTQNYSFLEAEIIAYAEDGLPMLELYFINNGQRNMLNKELVQRGLVSWYEMMPSNEST